MSKSIWVNGFLIMLYEDEGENKVNYTSIVKDRSHSDIEAIGQWIKERYNYVVAVEQNFALDIFFSNRPFKINDEGDFEFEDEDNV